MVAPVLAGCGAGGPATGPRVAWERATCVDAASMGSFSALRGAELVYEVDDRPTRFRIEPGFAGQVEAWLAEWDELRGAATARIGTYGSWLPNDGLCDSWHHAGRAFDVAWLADGSGAVTSCRYDRWGEDPAPGQLAAYWALAASLHAHFAYVLTYLYDGAHANHIHVDNSRSGAGRSVFSGSSRVQNQAVQAICTHVWGVPTAVTGGWDRATREAVRTVLADLGVRGGLTTGAVWQDFLLGSVAHWVDAS